MQSLTRDRNRTKSYDSKINIINIIMEIEACHIKSILVYYSANENGLK